MSGDIIIIFSGLLFQSYVPIQIVLCLCYVNLYQIQINHRINTKIHIKHIDICCRILHFRSYHIIDSIITTITTNNSCCFLYNYIIDWIGFMVDDRKKEWYHNFSIIQKLFNCDSSIIFEFSHWTNCILWLFFSKYELWKRMCLVDMVQNYICKHYIDGICLYHIHCSYSLWNLRQYECKKQ